MSETDSLVSASSFYREHVQDLRLTTKQRYLSLLIQMFWHTGLIRRRLRQVLAATQCQHGYPSEDSLHCLICLLKESFTRLQKHAGLFDVEQDPVYISRLELVAKHSDFTDCYESVLDSIRTETSNTEQVNPVQHFTLSVTEKRSACSCEPTSHSEVMDETILHLDAHTLVKALRDDGNLTKSLQQVLLSSAEDTRCQGCGEVVTSEKSVTNHPSLISLGLIWSEQVHGCIDKDIHLLLTSVQSQTLTFRNSPNAISTCEEPRALQVTGVICHAGSDYQAFFYHTKRQDWITFSALQPPQRVAQAFSAVVEHILDSESLPVLLVFSSFEALNSTPSAKAISTTDLSMPQHYPNQTGYKPGVYTNGYQKHPSYNQQFPPQPTINELKQHNWLANINCNTQSYSQVYPPENKGQSDVPIYTSDYGSYSSQESNHSGNTLYSSLAECDEYMNRIHIDPQSVSSHDYIAIRPNAPTIERASRSETRGREARQPPMVNRKEKPRPPPRRSVSQGRVSTRKDEGRDALPRKSFDDTSLINPSLSHFTTTSDSNTSYEDGPSYATLPRKKKTGPPTLIKPPVRNAGPATWMQQIAQKGEIMNVHKALSNGNKVALQKSQSQGSTVMDPGYIDRNTVQKILQQQKRVTNSSRGQPSSSSPSPKHSSGSRGSPPAPPPQHLKPGRSMSAPQVWDYNYKEPQEPATQVIAIVEPAASVNNQASGHGRQSSDEFEFPPPPPESDLIAANQNVGFSQASNPHPSHPPPSTNGLKDSNPQALRSTKPNPPSKPQVAKKPAKQPKPILKQKSVTFQIDQSNTSNNNVTTTTTDEFIPPPPQFCSGDMGYGDYETLSPEADIKPSANNNSHSLAYTTQEGRFRKQEHGHPGYLPKNSYSQHNGYGGHYNGTMQHSRPYQTKVNHHHQYSTEL